ncbi:MAG: hypothetical protein QM662_09195 [Gordonia sp. (in: high G+C Gram-positive bacteria)]
MPAPTSINADRVHRTSMTVAGIIPTGGESADVQRGQVSSAGDDAGDNGVDWTWQGG